MVDIARKFQQKNIKLLLANVKGPVRDLLSKSDFDKYVLDDQIFLSTHDAVYS